jgi:cytochrome c
MDSFELNKIIAAVLMTALIVIGLNKFSDAIFHVEKPEQSAYKVEGVELASSNAGEKEEKEEVVQLTIQEILATGDAAYGEQVFKKCSGKQSASAPDYAYSSALQAYGKVWSFEELNAFLLKPQAYIKGTKMAYAGLRKDKDRASVILYLNSQSDSPLPKP